MNRTSIVQVNTSSTKNINNNNNAVNNENSADETALNIDDAEWKEYHENILVDWADKALCYKWLHSKSCEKYQFLRNIYTIPVIIISTLTGTANFAQERFPENTQALAQIAIGSLNILAGIITTVSQFLKINELAEAHRVSAISWDKFYRNIRVELVKAPEDRINVTYLIKSCKDEYDRLMETSPSIDPSIIKKFNGTFKINSNDKNIKNKALQSLSKPEILNSLESTRNILYKEEFNASSFLDKKNSEEINNKKIINDFISNFEKEYSRKPSMIEIYDNLESKMNVNTINNYINESDIPA